MRRGVLRSAVVVAALFACQRQADEPRVVDAAAPQREATSPSLPKDIQPAPPIEAAVVETIAPSSPASLVVRATSASEISLSWAPASDGVAVAGYEVARDGTLLARASGSTSIDRSVRPGRRYCYSVVALDEAGNRSLASAVACASTPDVAPPSTPAGVTAVATSDRVLAVSWSASTDDSGVATYEVYRGDMLVAATPKLQLAEERLEPASRYCYAVVALDHAGNRSPRSEQACAATPDLTPPSVPANVVGRSWGEHEIVLGWSASDDDVGVVGYELLRDGKVLAKVTETSASENGLESWREYCYEVRAFDAAGNRSAATKPTCARTHDLTPPSAPAPVATAVSDHEITIRWDASVDNVGVAAYEVERHEGIVARSGTLEFSQKGLSPAVRYCFWVRATDPAGNKSDRIRACATTPDLSPPSTPGHLAVAPRAATEVVAAWKASQDDVGVVAYEVVRGDEVVASVTRTWTVLTNLAPESEHCFAVRARDAAGNRSLAAGPLCAKTPDPTTPPGPANLRVEVLTTGVQLGWEPSPLPDVVYAVYRDEDGRVGMTRAEKYTLAGSLASRAGCYRVAAVDAAGRESPRTISACAPARVSVSAR